MEIYRGKINTAIKAVVFGPEGIGKTTFASRFPAPVFIDTEGGTKRLDVARVAPPTSWTMLLEQVKYFRDTPGEFKTLVIDTADWAEMRCIEHICAKAKKDGIEDFSYGKGYTYVYEEFGRLLNLLTEVVEGGMHVVVTAHAKPRKFELPEEMGSYDRWEMKLSKGVAPMVKEWADIVLFANYETYVVKGEKENERAKAQGGRRVMYTSHHPCWDAKNRFGLPEKLDFDFNAIAHILTPVAITAPEADIKSDAEFYLDGRDRTAPDAPGQETPATPDPAPTVTPAPVATPEPTPPPAKSRTKMMYPGIPTALADLMDANNVLEMEIREIVAKKGYYPLETPVERYDPAFVEGVLVAAWGQVFPLIIAARSNDLPY